MSASEDLCSSRTVMISRIVCFVLLFLFIVLVVRLFLLASPQCRPVDRLLKRIVKSCNNKRKFSSGPPFVPPGVLPFVPPFGGAEQTVSFSKRKNTHKHTNTHKRSPPLSAGLVLPCTSSNAPQAPRVFFTTPRAWPRHSRMSPGLPFDSMSQRRGPAG
jgi:hypothetical protein